MCAGIACLTREGLLAVACLASLSALARETVDLDLGWRFARGPLAGAETVGCNDGEPSEKWAPRIWMNVDLPHDFQFSLPWDRAACADRGFKAMGEGWYRRHFMADPAWKGKRVGLDFGGIMCLGEVYLNGEKIAASDYGYLGFEISIEDKLRWDEDNVIAVRTSTGNVLGSRWYTGGGLCRGVKLIARDKVSVSRHGVFVSTPNVSEEKATVAVQVEVDGWTRRTNDLHVAVDIFNKDGKRMASATAEGPKDVRLTRVAINLPTVTIRNPHLWDIEAPNLYIAEVSLSVDGVETDRIRQRFGIRKIEFSPDFGFKLNGRKVFLQGMCNHADCGALGAAAHPRAIRRQFKTMKEFGYNAYRCSHNPYSEEFYDLADEMGLLIIDELADKWSGNTCSMGRPMTEQFFPLITEWVRRDRNHPSVIVWSLGNELQYTEEFAGFPSDDFGVTTYRIFETVVRRWDPTRKLTVAMFPARAGGYSRSDGKERFFTDKTPPALSCATDIASYNYVWYDFADYKAKVPHLNFFQSEATVLDCLLPYWGMDRDTMIGLAYWGAIAYWGESTDWPAKGWYYSFFGHDLRPMPTAYLIRTAFKPDVPQAYLAVDEGTQARYWNDVRVGRRKYSSNWNRKNGDKVDMVVFTNGDEAELLINGRSLGVRKNRVEKPDVRNILSWKDVEWERGTIEVVAIKDGKKVATSALETVGLPEKLEIIDETPGWCADGRDLKFLRLNAVDSNGRLVITASDQVRVSVDGPARLIALDDGDHDTDSVFDETTKALREGSLLVILRAGTDAGEVAVTFDVDNLGKYVRRFTIDSRQGH